MQSQYTPFSTPTKQCRDCKEHLPATAQYFYRDRTRLDGLESCCKRCKAKRRGTTFREPAPSAPDGYKWCRHCGKVKSLAEFHLRSDSPDGHRSACKQCRAENEGFRYRPPVPDGHRRCAKCSQILPATTEHFYPDNRYSGMLSAWCKSCVRDNVTKWASNHPERVAKTKRRWARANPEKIKVARQRRIVRERRARDTMTAFDWQRALDYFGGRCAVCGRPPGLFHTLAMDHWIPLASTPSPGNVPDNVIPLCHGKDGCNNRKSNRKPEEWLQAQFGKRKAAQIQARIETYFEWVRSQRR